MSRLKSMQDKVEWALSTYPQTRDNDNLLTCVIYTRFYGVDMMSPFKDVMLYQKLPAFETIRRCRQKAQELNENLRGKRDKERIARQQEYIEYALQDTKGDRI